MSTMCSGVTGEAKQALGPEVKSKQLSGALGSVPGVGSCDR